MKKTLSDLRNILKALDPPISPKFHKAAKEKDIETAETALGLPFPDELKEFLTCHNGQHFFSKGKYIDPFVPMTKVGNHRCSHYWFGSAAEIVEFTETNRHEYDDYFGGERFDISGPTSYHKDLVVLTTGENPDRLALDMQPKQGGRMGQVVVFSTQPFYVSVIASNLKEYIQNIIDGYREIRFQYISSEIVVSYGEWSDSGTL